jgi:hypothetical protein
MFIKATKMDWEIGSVICQLVFFLAGSGVFIFAYQNHDLRNPALYYLAVMSLSLLVAMINAFLLRKEARYFIALVIIMSNAFIIPFTFYAFGLDIGYAVGCSLIYVVVTIAMTPRLVGIATLFSAIGFACFMYYQKEIFEPFSNFMTELSKYEEKIKQQNKPLSGNKFKYYTVEEPGTLKDISKRKEVYGDETLWRQLLNANQDKVKDGNHIVKSGTELVVPSQIKKNVFKINTYIVTEKSTLAEISANSEVYGRKDYWKYLFDANRVKLKNSPGRGGNRVVFGGTELRVPEVPTIPLHYFFKIASAYFAGALLAYCWRLLIEKMYTLYQMAMSKSSQTLKQEVNKIKSRLNKSESDCQMLKEETALHIMEMKKILEHNKK